MKIRWVVVGGCIVSAWAVGFLSHRVQTPAPVVAPASSASVASKKTRRDPHAGPNKDWYYDGKDSYRLVEGSGWVSNQQSGCQGDDSEGYPLACQLGPDESDEAYAWYAKRHPVLSEPSPHGPAKSAKEGPNPAITTGEDDEPESEETFVRILSNSIEDVQSVPRTRSQSVYDSSMPSEEDKQKAAELHRKVQELRAIRNDPATPNARKAALKLQIETSIWMGQRLDPEQFKTYKWRRS